MKRIILLVVIIFLVSGCSSISKEQGEKFNKLLMNENIIGNNYELDDVIRFKYQLPSGGANEVEYHYVLKNNNQLILVKYKKNDTKGNGSYEAFIYFNPVRKDVEEVNCSYNDSYKINNICYNNYPYDYNEEAKKEYVLIEKRKFFFWKEYVVEDKI